MSKAKLYEGTTTERIDRLADYGIIHSKHCSVLKETIPKNWADNCNMWIENAVGYLPMPFGIANNIPINDKLYHLPLAIEETSVIAGLCKMGKLIREQGKLTTKHLTSEIIGQVPFKDITMTDAMQQQWSILTKAWIEETNLSVLSGLLKRGGGITNIDFKIHQSFFIVHIHCNPCDAMGANLINQAAEFLKPKLETFFKSKAITAILSNLNQPRVEATIEIKNFDPVHGQNIVSMSEWANVDPHRASTHNKGIFNGIDAMCIATGNDWRAVSAGGHAYAARDGQYRGLSNWSYSNQKLIGKLIMPIGIGTVGGVTKQHPISKISLEMLDQPDADTLAQIMIACGLLQNLAALHALTNDGIVAGHMRLHITNMVQDLNLSKEKASLLQHHLEEKLKSDGHITHSIMKQLLDRVKD